MIASTGQGRRLRSLTRRLAIPVNSPFTPVGIGDAALVRGDSSGSIVNWANDLTIRVVHPGKQRLREMQQQWGEDVREAAKYGDNSIVFASLGNRDTAPSNVASIVCLVESSGKRNLLTGNARDDDILDGLARAGVLDVDDRVHVDSLKIAHHGSDRNVSTDLFKHVTADHYVISGDGKHGNPETSTLEMLSSETSGQDDVTVHFVNHEGEDHLEEKLDQFVAAGTQLGRTYRFEFRAHNALSSVVNLLDEIDS